MTNSNNSGEHINRLSETAQKILNDSELYAKALNSGFDTHHLLIGIASNPGTLAYEWLREVYVTPERLSYALHSNVKLLQTKDAISSDLKKALIVAHQQAAKYDTATVDSEHLLFSLVSNKQSNAYQMLLLLEVDPKVLLEQIEDYFDQLAHDGEEEELDDIDSIAPPFIQQPTRGLPAAQQKAKSAIEYFTTDLTKLAKDKKLDPVVGRENEIRRITQILIRRVKNNPVLTGEPGVGKTAIAEGLAQRIADGDIPPQLSDKRVLSLDLALLVSGTTYRGQFEERTKRLIDEIITSKNVILFVDELHTIVGAGAAEGSIDLSNILKPALAKGQLRLIGATTNDEYRKYIEKDPALERRLQRVSVEEPSVEETIKILTGLKETYEQHHLVKIENDAVVAAAELSKRYISDRFLPDKAIDLIDEAAAATQLEEKQLSAYNELAKLEKRRRKAKSEHMKLAEKEEYKKAAEWKVLEYKLIDQIDQLKAKLPRRTKVRSINRQDIAKIVAMWTGVPVQALEKTDLIKLSSLEKSLENYIVGQKEAIKTVTSAIKRSSTGVTDPNRPLGSFIFLGPTGVGKTELAKVLAREVYGREEALVKIDMSEFMERHNVSRLVGAPPGYIGYDDAGKLTETIRRQPYSVVLLDEIEKAHPDIFNMLLQIMEDGYITDAKGRKVNFCNTILIMTSNIGMAELNRQAAIGFKTSNQIDAAGRYDAIKSRISDELKQYFRPEFLNRLDKVVIFKPLGQIEVKEIVRRQIKRLSDRLLPEGIDIQVAAEAIDFLAEKGFDPEFGARPVRRVITEYVEDPLSELLLTGKISKSAPIRVLRKGTKLALVK